MKVVMIGAGNVGTHLGRAIHQTGNKVIQIFGRTPSKVNSLAHELGCIASTSLKKISAEGDVYIIAVTDDAIDEVAKAISFLPDDKLVLHTAGVTPSLVLKPYFKNFGVFYPLQTFSLSRPVDFKKIPICIEGSDKNSLDILQQLAETLSEKVFHLNDRERFVLHVAAVFANNFSNHMFTVADRICKSENLDFNILKPLIRETVDKVMQNDPELMQTGPAKRGDDKTIGTHLEYLKQHPDFKNIYEQLSKSIRGYYE